MHSEGVVDTGHSAAVTDVAAHDSGTKLATAGEDGVVCVYACVTSDGDTHTLTATASEGEGESAACAWRLTHKLSVGGGGGAVRCVAWAPVLFYRSAFVACSDADRRVSLWRAHDDDDGGSSGAGGGGADDYACVYRATLPAAGCCVAWAPAEYGKLFAVGCVSGVVVVYTGHDDATWDVHSFAAYGVAPATTTAAAAAATATVAVACTGLSFAPFYPPGALLMAPLEADVLRAAPAVTAVRGDGDSNNASSLGDDDDDTATAQRAEREAALASLPALPIAPPRLVTCGGGGSGGDSAAGVVTMGGSSSSNKTGDAGDACVCVWTHAFAPPSVPGAVPESVWSPSMLPQSTGKAWRVVAWSPNVGLPFTYIAAGADDGVVAVWSQDGPRLDAWRCHVLPRQPAAVTRVSWSHAGTLLLVSCASGTATTYIESPTTGEWDVACELHSPAV